MLRRPLLSWMTWLPMLLLMWGCATPPPNTPPPTGAMLMVRLLTKQEPLDSMALQVTMADQAEPMATVSGMLYSRSGGKSADYLFPIPLKPGRYKLSPAGSAPPFQLGFEVVAGPPVYVGRLLLSQDGARPPSLENHQGEDLPMFRNAVAQLRSIDIGLRLGELQRSEPPPSAAPSTVPRPLVMEVVLATDELANELPMPARSAFARYMKLRSPRAFAVNDIGFSGVASGKGAVERAMQECNKLDPGQPCRLFSVDQTATLWRASQSPVAAPVPVPVPAPAPTLPPRSLPSSGTTAAAPVAPQPAPSVPTPAPVVAAPAPVAAPQRAPVAAPVVPVPAPAPVAVTPAPALVAAPAPAPVRPDPCQPKPEFKGWLKLSDVAPQEAAARRKANGCTAQP